MPPAEVLQYCHRVSADRTPSDDELVDLVARLLHHGQSAAELRNAVIAAKRLDTQADDVRGIRPAGTSASSSSVCFTCVTIHAGECA